MAYSFQTFSVLEVLGAAKMNQVEVNIRDHVHGVAGVVAITGSILTIVDAKGDLLVGSAADAVARLGIGSAGQLLQVATDTPGWINPALIGAGWTLIAPVQVAGNSAAISFTSIDNANYQAYRLVVRNAWPVSNSVNLLLQVSNAGVFVTSGYTWLNYRWTTAASAVSGQAAAGSGVVINSTADPVLNTANIGLSAMIDWCQAGQTNDTQMCTYQSLYLGSARLGVAGAGENPTPGAVDGFRFKFDSGNISVGTFALYGMRNA